MEEPGRGQRNPERAGSCSLRPPGLGPRDSRSPGSRVPAALPRAGVSCAPPRGQPMASGDTHSLRPGSRLPQPFATPDRRLLSCHQLGAAGTRSCATEAGLGTQQGAASCAAPLRGVGRGGGGGTGGSARRGNEGEAPADPAPCLKRVLVRPATGPAKPRRPATVPPGASSRGAEPWGRVGSPPPRPHPALLARPVPVGDCGCRSSLDSAPNLTLERQFSVGGKRGGKRGGGEARRLRRIGEPWKETRAKKRRRKLVLIEMFAINCSC